MKGMGFGNMGKKHTEQKTEPGKVEIPKEILSEQKKYTDASEKEMVLSVKEKLSFFLSSTVRVVFTYLN